MKIIRHHHLKYRSNRQGFAVLMVLGTMLLVGATVVGMGALCEHEMARTRSALTETQLRQLLTAAIPTAQAELAKTGPTERDVTMPTPVDGAKVTLHVAMQPSAVPAAQVTVRAELGGYWASQAVHYESSGGGWTITEVRFTDSGGQIHLK